SVGIGVGAGQPQNFSTTSASLPNLSLSTQANSFAVLCYVDIHVIPGSTVDLIEVANGTLKVQVTAASRLVAVSGANSTTGVQDPINGPGMAGGSCFAALLVVNKTKGTNTLYTNQEVIRVTPGTLSSTKSFLYGGSVANAVDAFMPYGALWIGA